MTDYPDVWTEVAFAHEQLGDLHRSRGDLTSAAQAYRAALDTSPNLSGTSGEVHLSLGEVALAHNPADLEELEQLLAAARPHAAFNSTCFRWHVLAASVASARGDQSARRAEATAALALVNAVPQFARHPTVGLVQPLPETVAKLQQMAGE